MIHFFPIRPRGTVSACFLLSFALMAGCATPRRVALPPVTLPEVATSATIVGLAKREIGTDIVRSRAADGMGAAGGLIGSLIGSAIDASVNSSRAKTVEAAAASVRDALLTFDAGAALAESLHQELAPVSWLKNQTVEVREVTDPKGMAALVNGSRADIVLLVDTRYNLTPTFDGIVVTARVSVHPRGKTVTAAAQEKEGLPKLIYFNVLSSTWSDSAVSAGAGPADNAAHWAAEDGKAAKAALTSALNELAKMVAYDFQQPGRPNNAMYKRSNGQTERTVTSVPGNVVIQQMRGFVEKKVETRDWVRLPAGELSALP